MSMYGGLLRISPADLDVLVADPGRVVGILVYPKRRPDTRMQYDLDKAWHILHFLLTGNAWGGQGPLANAILGGETLGSVDVGYGPARFLRASQVVEVSEALRTVPAKQLWSRFDAQACLAADIYPTNCWTSQESEYVMEVYEGLRSFYQLSAQHGDAMLLYVQ